MFQKVKCILKPGGEVVKPPFEIDHAVEKLDALVSLINSFDEETRVVLEDTGHYHLPVASYLSSGKNLSDRFG